MKKQLLTTLFGLAAISVQAGQISQNKPAPAPQANCSMLTDAEQTFASTLMPGNRMMFCNQFNPDQRSTAMQMSGQTDENGNMVTADAAVVKVAQDNNLMMPPTSPAQPQQPAPSGGSSGGCPVKQSGQ